MIKIVKDLTRYVRSAGYALYLFSPFGLRKPAHRSFVISEIPKQFGYHPIQPDLPVLSVDEICRPGKIELLEIRDQNGNVSVLELVILSKLIAQFKPKRIFEIGTFDGRTTLNMAANAVDAAIYTLDLPRSGMDATGLPVETADKMFIDKTASGTRFAGSQYGRRIVQLYGDSATFDFAPYAGSIDLVFVDGAHSFEYVMRDSANAMRMLSSRGVIVWHDYTSWPGVTRALNNLYAEDSQLRWIAGTSLAVRI